MTPQTVDESAAMAIVEAEPVAQAGEGESTAKTVTTTGIAAAAERSDIAGGYHMEEEEDSNGIGIEVGGRGGF